MHSPQHEHLWEELKDIQQKLTRYDGDVFQSLKDMVLDFFNTHKRLKDSIERSQFISKTEPSINSNIWLGIELENTNKESYFILRDKHSDEEVGNIDFTDNVKIELDSEPITLEEITELIIGEWESVLDL